MEEIWKDIEGYEGLYQVSNLGRVKSLYKKEKILKLGAVSSGYFFVHLYKMRKLKVIRVHRLVALTFVPNTENKLEVNHKDGNKQNNRADNLEWATKSENVKHSYSVLHIKNPNGRGVVNIFSKNGEYITQVKNLTEAASWVKENTVYKCAATSNIANVCNGKKRLLTDSNL